VYGLGLMSAGVAEAVTLVPTIVLAALAVWWFRSSSMLREAKAKTQAEEDGKKDAGDNKDVIISGAEVRVVETTGTSPDPAGEVDGAGSSREGSNAPNAPNAASEGGQGTDKNGEEQAEETHRGHSRRNGRVSDDLEQGFTVGSARWAARQPRQTYSGLPSSIRPIDPLDLYV
jgi:hypothetical protein